MPGIPEFSGPRNISQNNAKAATYKNITDNTTVSAGQTKLFTIRAPAGKIWYLTNMRIRAPAIGSATTGGHNFNVRSEGAVIDVTAAKSSYNNAVEFNNSDWTSADKWKDPSGQHAMAAINTFVIDDSSGIEFRYNNDTDASQTNSRMFRLMVEEEEVA